MFGKGPSPFSTHIVTARFFIADLTSQLTAFFLPLIKTHGVWAIFLCTLILEDLALTASISLIAASLISPTHVFIANFVGICIGDLAFYGLGLGIARATDLLHWEFLKRWRRNIKSRSKNIHSLGIPIVLSRAVPGTRIPVYMAAGYLRFPFGQFLILTLISVFAWVLFALTVGRSLSVLFQGHWVLLILCFLAVGFSVRNFCLALFFYWPRKALLHSWRRGLYLEYWPAWILKLPLFLQLLWLSIRHRSLTTALFANPGMSYGGLVASSQWDLYRHFDESADYRLSTFFLSKESAQKKQLLALLNKGRLTYPFILKPDASEDGYGVRNIRSEDDLTVYFQACNFDLIAQQISPYPNEVEVFYGRKPGSQSGKILAITAKEFPTLVGDGVTSLGNLILRDTRARLMTQRYFQRFGETLDTVLPKGESLQLVTSGCHGQGALLKNADVLGTQDLTLALDQVTANLPGFFVGRIDLRYESSETLGRGKGFQVLGVKGPHLSAPDVWDPSLSVSQACQKLFAQWQMIFSIGELNQKQSSKPQSFFGFVRQRFRSLKNPNLKTSS